MVSRDVASTLAVRKRTSGGGEVSRAWDSSLPSSPLKAWQKLSLLAIPPVRQEATGR